MNRLANLIKRTYLNEETVNHDIDTKRKEKENRNPMNTTIDKQPTRRRCPYEEDEKINKVIRKPSKHNKIFLFNSTQKKYIEFYCFGEEEMVPEKFKNMTIERKQDDDCQSDEEVLKQSTKYLYDELLDALSAENKKRYSRQN